MRVCGRLAISYSLLWAARAARGPNINIRAMSTPSLRSLDLDAICPVVPFPRPPHSGLVLIDHECAAGRGMRGP
jgi:hypothetical protein